MVRFSGPDVRLAETIERPFKHRSDSQSHVTFRTGGVAIGLYSSDVSSSLGSPGFVEKQKAEFMDQKKFPDRWPATPPCKPLFSYTGWASLGSNTLHPTQGVPGTP